MGQHGQVVLWAHTSLSCHGPVRCQWIYHGILSLRWYRYIVNFYWTVCSKSIFCHLVNPHWNTLPGVNAFLTGNQCSAAVTTTLMHHYCNYNWVTLVYWYTSHTLGDAPVGEWCIMHNALLARAPITAPTFFVSRIYYNYNTWSITLVATGGFQASYPNVGHWQGRTDRHLVRSDSTNVYA